MKYTKSDRDFFKACYNLGVTNENHREIIHGLISDIEELEASHVSDTIRPSDGEREFLVELSDMVVMIVKETELREWIKSDEEFDGIHGWIMRGELIPAAI